MNNVRFTYLYRDGSNYKKCSEVVFSNAAGISAEIAFKRIKDALLPDGLFIAHQVRIPEVFLAFEDQITEDDHCYHEFDTVESTTDVANDAHGRSIRDFIDELSRESMGGWRAFSPWERIPGHAR